VEEAAMPNGMDTPVPRPDLDFQAARVAMVEDQLLTRGIRDRRVLEVMATVPRELFVPEDLHDMAYADRPLPIGYGQTISQPYTTAFMTEALGLRGTEAVLEVGTGSGYSTAILACLARRVYSVDRIAPLVDAARTRLHRIGLENVDLRVTDGTLGLPEEGPFDAIVVDAGGIIVPPPYREQLADGGRIVIPLGPASDQVLTRVTRRGDQWRQESLGDFLFVPLIGVHGHRGGEPLVDGY
jgi:protein-L-isoaspartate(D-aspartate) O-methyltransferase